MEQGQRVRSRTHGRGDGVVTERLGAREARARFAELVERAARGERIVLT
ncbi:MAG: type II toxin-antitoxin system prevent-host-death family antitoxin, partial [Microthrixaceae bacterium]|nr:type II toxin-antitoxin system prevent-host-death family antitoxin [Microthrixaceae bacterium]